MLYSTSVSPKPTVFIGSSSEGLNAAEALARLLETDAEVTIWHEGVFGLGEGTLEALMAEAKRVDFAVLLLTADDLVTSRKRRLESPRDNVLFESGLFMGTLGRRRTFLTFDRRRPPKLPSDLAGITLAAFGDAGGDQSFETQLAPAATAIRAAIQRMGTLRPTPPEFWRPFVQGGCSIVLGRFGKHRSFEPSGLVGLGDAACLAELSACLRAQFA